MTKHYDIILAGSGLSGLTLALELAGRPFFQDKTILLIDRDEKQKNDRTWCFWATDEERIPPVVFKTWDKCHFFGADFETVLDIAPFRYRMVRGLDFYHWAKTKLSEYPNIQRLTANIVQIDASSGTVRTEQGEFLYPGTPFRDATGTEFLNPGTPFRDAAGTEFLYPGTPFRDAAGTEFLYPGTPFRDATGTEFLYPGTPFRDATGTEFLYPGTPFRDATGTEFRFTGTWIFNSAVARFPVVPEASALYPNPPFTVQPESQIRKPPTGYTRLLQHFKGWLIETPTPAFDPARMTFMDYRLDQKGETRFVYVLPFTENRALVEFTVFSEALCSAEAYDAALKQYVNDFLKIKDFRIVEQEFGVIPMTDDPFMPKAEGHVIHIGTAGGFVKASSGYAFKRTQRKLHAFAAAWERTGSPDPALLQSAWHYRFFDSVMLRVLRENAVSGKDFFTGLFQQLPSPLVLRFLDEDTTFTENIRLLSAPPTWPFLKTAWKQIPVFRKI